MPKSLYTKFRHFKCACGKRTNKCDGCNKRICHLCRKNNNEFNILSYCFICYKRRCYDYLNRKYLCFNNVCNKCKFCDL